MDTDGGGWLVQIIDKLHRPKYSFRILIILFLFFIIISYSHVCFMWTEFVPVNSSRCIISLVVFQSLNYYPDNVGSSVIGAQLYENAVLLCWSSPLLIVVDRYNDTKILVVDMVTNKLFETFM